MFILLTLIVQDGSRAGLQTDCRYPASLSPQSMDIVGTRLTCEEHSVSPLSGCWQSGNPVCPRPPPHTHTHTHTHTHNLLVGMWVPLSMASILLTQGYSTCFVDKLSKIQVCCVTAHTSCCRTLDESMRSDSKMRRGDKLVLSVRVLIEQTGSVVVRSERNPTGPPSGGLQNPSTNFNSW
jgi:hypothetical protein